MPTIAVTVVGHDRPGIVHAVTGAVAEVAGNLEDSSMTLLRGHFAMTVIARLPDDDAAADVSRRLEALRAEGLAVSVLPLPDEGEPVGGTGAVLSVHGADRPGIVHAATGILLEFGGNITDLSTRLSRDLYVLTADVTLPPKTDVDEVSRALAERMADYGVKASLRPAEEDVL